MRRSAEPSRHAEIVRRLDRLVDGIAAMIDMMDDYLRAGPIDAMVPVETQADVDMAFALLHAEPAGVA